MWRIRELKICFILFYLFSQTSFIPIRCNQSKLLRFGSLILKIFQFFIPITLLIGDIIRGFLGSSPKNFDEFVLQFAVYFHFFCCYYILYSNMFPSFSSYHICEFIATIIQQLELKFRNFVQLDKFKKIFLRKFMITLVLQTFVLIWNLVLDFHLESLPIISILILSCTKHASAFYAIFLIDLMSCLLHFVNKMLKEISRDPNKNGKIFATLRHLKWFHNNLFKFSKFINDRFGFLIIIYLMDNFTIFYVMIYRCVVSWPSIGIASK